MNASEKRVEAVRAAIADALSFLCPGDSEEIQEKLYTRFFSPASIFESGEEMLVESGLSRDNALIFSLVPDFARRVSAEAFGKSPRLDTVLAAGNYLKTRFIGLWVEHFYLLCLDGSGKLLDSVLVQRGTTDSAPFYVRHILKEAVRTRASALVISHNHPNNSMRPSEGDLHCTYELLSALRALRIPLLDHIIIVNKQSVSFRQCGIIPEKIWLAQAPVTSLLTDWLRDCEEF